jgi:hypothetical protein
VVQTPKLNASFRNVATDVLKGGIQLSQDADFHHRHCDTEGSILLRKPGRSAEGHAVLAPHQI